MAKAKPKQSKKADFEAVAKRLSCDPDMNTFDKKLRKTAKAKAIKRPSS
jgi:hypothetical protein